MWWGDIFGVPITVADTTGSGCGYSTQSSGDFKLAIDEDADLTVVDSMVGKNLMAKAGPSSVHKMFNLQPPQKYVYENGSPQANINVFDSNDCVSKPMVIDIPISTHRPRRRTYFKKKPQINSKNRVEMLTSILHACYMANTRFSAQLVIRRFVKYIKSA